MNALQNQNQNSRQVVSKSARRRLNRRLRTQVQQPIVVSRPVAVQLQQGSGRTARNRRKRLRRRQRLRGGVGSMGVGVNTFGMNSRYLQIDPMVEKYVAPDTERMAKISVHKCLQNHFFPDSGLHRGLAEGSGNSAIHMVESSITINSLTSTNNVLSIYLAPTALTAASAGAIKVSTDVTDPTAAPTASIAGPYNGAGNNPSTDYRVVHFSARLIPSGAFTNQAGEGKVGYLPDAFRINSNWNRATIDNILWSAPLTGVTNMALHWVPNEYETDFVGSGYGKSSAFVGYIAVPSGQATGTQFRLDLQWGIEYYPTAAAAKIVSVSPPEMHPSTYYHFNKIARSLHNPLIVGTWDEYCYYRDQFQGLASVDNPQASAIGNFARTNVDAPAVSASYNDSYEPGIIGRYMRQGLQTVGALSPFYLMNQYARANRVNQLGRPAMHMMPDV